jgi:hypothetical protein
LFSENLTMLGRDLHKLRSIALREERVNAGGEGYANPAFASTPLDLGAQDLIDECEDALQQVASDCGIWAGGGWQAILRKLPARVARVQSLTDYRMVERITVKARNHVTPPVERIAIGACLDCGAALSVARGQKAVECRSCGLLQAVSEVWEMRRTKLRETGARTKPMTPSRAASWLRHETHAQVSRQAVFMRLSRGMMPHTRDCGGGYYEFDKSELLDLVESIATHGVS